MVALCSILFNIQFGRSLLTQIFSYDKLEKLEISLIFEVYHMKILECFYFSCIRMGRRQKPIHMLENVISDFCLPINQDLLKFIFMYFFEKNKV